MTVRPTPHRRVALLDLPRPDGRGRHPTAGALPWLVWAVGLAVYVVAVFHRFSLGVAGIEAAHRLGVSPATLSLFPVLQLLVYALMQIPVGVLLDRYGSKRLLLTGLIVMTGGQVLFGLAGTAGLAVGARVLLGAGDAMVFISVLRLITMWFPARRAGVVSQLTGVIGQLGAVVSAAPLAAALHSYGWTASFVGAAVVGGLVLVPLLFAVSDAPAGTDSDRRDAPSLAAVRRSLRLAWREPGTRLGLWTHFTTQFSGVVFAVLWGFPFLVSAQGLSTGTASALLTLYVLAGIAVGPLLGQFAARLPFHRSRLALGIVAVAATAWAVVLLWPGPAPLPVLIALVVAIAPTGPGSMIGFDHARLFNPPARLGSAAGIVNVGGFGASLIAILAIGVVLDLLTPGGGGTYELGAFRWAFAVQYLLWGLGVVQILRYRRAARCRLAVHHPEAYDALRRGELPSLAA